MIGADASAISNKKVRARELAEQLSQTKIAEMLKRAEGITFFISDIMIRF